MTTDRNSLRVGIVSSVDASTGTARVYFPDMGDMTSGWLYVLHHGDAWMPSVNDRVLCQYMTGEETDGYIVGVIP